MKNLDKLALGAVGVILITNPASGQVILQGLEWGFGMIFKYASPVNFAATGIVLFYIAKKMWDSREQVKVPSKMKKLDKAGKFIES